MRSVAYGSFWSSLDGDEEELRLILDICWERCGFTSSTGLLVTPGEKSS